MTSTNTTDHFPIIEDALAYRQAHDARAKALHRMSMPVLRDLERGILAAQGRVRIAGGPVSKNEFETAILDAEFPRDRLNESIHVAYHKPGENWSACEWCQS